MKSKLIAVGVGAIASLFMAGSAMAQDPDEIQITGSRAIAVTPERSTNGDPVHWKTLSLGYHVSAVGLDLNSVDGMKKLEMRVNAAALVSCREIGEQYPFASPSDAECADAAVTMTMAKVRNSVKVAQ